MTCNHSIANPHYPYLKNWNDGAPGLKNNIYIALLISALAHGAVASDLDYPNRYSGMAESMFDMMDAFSSAYQRRKGNEMDNWSSGNFGSWPMNPGSMGSMGSLGGFPGMSPFSSPFSGFNQPFNSFSPGSLNRWPMPRGYPNTPSSTAILDGKWQSNSGEVMVIDNGQFRIYRSRSEYRDGRLRLHGRSLLSLQDLNSGNSMEFEYALQNDRLALRDQRGNLLLYKRSGR
jgi:hypothetical protein